MSRRHALRCPQTELTPHKLHRALLNHLTDVGLPCVPEFQEIFTSADASPGPIWTSAQEQAQESTRQKLQQLCPGSMMRWGEPTADDHQKPSMTSDAQLLGTNPNQSSIVCFAYLCLGLEGNPEWLPAVQAKSNVDTSGSAGAFAWGLMLPTSTRTAGSHAPALWEFDMMCCANF